MNGQTKIKQIMKILIGAAWIDGVIQAPEREYLHKMAENNNLSSDLEIQSLLSEIKPVSASECYQWLEEYLGERHDRQDYEQLLEAISALVYSDGDVDIQEARLLSRIQDLDPENQGSQSIFEQLLKSIQKLYRQAVNQK